MFNSLRKDPETGWYICEKTFYPESRLVRFLNAIRRKPSVSPVHFIDYCTKDRHYIASVNDTEHVQFLLEHGINPEPALPSSNVCSIGFSQKEQRWYGWSHRTWASFNIGDAVDSDDHVCATSGWTEEYLRMHPEKDVVLPVGFTARTLEDARKMAVAFAEAVA